MSIDKIVNAIKESRDGLNKVLDNNETIENIQQAAELIVETISNKSKISRGNGGSMCELCIFLKNYLVVLEKIVGDCQQSPYPILLL